MKLAALTHLVSAFILMHSEAHAAYFEREQVQVKDDETIISIKAHLPGGYQHPSLVNCQTTGTSLSCDLNAPSTEHGVHNMEGFIPFKISTTLPYSINPSEIIVKHNGHDYIVR